MTEQPGQSLEQQVAQMKFSAGQLREAVKAEYEAARTDNTPAGYREALVKVRTWQDSLEEYVAFAISAKGAMERQAADAKLKYDEAWAQAAHQNSQGATRRGEDFEGPRERYARFDVAVFKELRAWRRAENALALAAEMLDEMWLRYRAVNATRQDLDSIMRGYAFESSMERLREVR